MPSVKLSVRLAFDSGEEVVSTAESPEISAAVFENGHAPYSLIESSTPEQPVLVSSSDFVQVG
jgi:hypothetical protein